MKNLILSSNMTILFTSALLLACSVTTPEPTTVSDIDPNQPAITTTTDIATIYANNGWVVTGDTTIPKKIAKLPTLPTITVDVSALKNTTDPTLSTTPLRMIAVGGSLASGMRDGGLTQESQLTCYPNLIARQMKLAAFRQPLFADNEYNGYGYKVPTTSNTAVPRFNGVKNNTAVRSVDSYGNVTLNPYLGGDIDNFAVPYLGTAIKINVLEKSINAIYPFTPFLYRVNNNKSILDKLSGQKYDLLTIESDFDYKTTVAFRGSGGGGSLMFINDPTYNLFLQLLIDSKKNGVKVLMANTPDITDFPYFNAVTLSKLKEATKSTNIYYRVTNG